MNMHNCLQYSIKIGYFVQAPVKEKDNEIRLKNLEIDNLNKEIDKLHQLLPIQKSDAGISGHSSSVREVSTVL